MDVQRTSDGAEAELSAASAAPHGEENPLAPSNLFRHVQDAEFFHVPKVLDFDGMRDGHIYLPQFRGEEPVVRIQTGAAVIDNMIQPFNLRLTKFMALEVVAGLIVIALFTWVAHKIKTGERPRGRMWNLLEAMLLFIRDQVARPAIGKHDADRYLPFLWTLFFFILACNLLGMIPWAGSPTSALAVTGMLAIICLAVSIGSGMAKLGAVGYWKAQMPDIDLPFVLGPLKIMIFFIEVLGTLIKHFVLAIRLFANMMAGHMVLGVLTAFVAVAWAVNVWVFAGVAPVAIAGATALSLLELFVAFLQAYIFVFLASLFIGMAVHPH